MDKQELNFEEINIPDFIPVYPKLSSKYPTDKSVGFKPD